LIFLEPERDQIGIVHFFEGNLQYALVSEPEKGNVDMYEFIKKQADMGQIYKLILGTDEIK
jgi:hypothetical protein